MERPKKCNTTTIGKVRKTSKYICTLVIILITNNAFSDNLKVRLVGLNDIGKKVRVTNLTEISLINNGTDRKTIDDYTSNNLIIFNSSNITYGDKIKFLVTASGWRIAYPRNGVTYKPKNIDNEIIELIMVTNKSMLIIENMTASFTNSDYKNIDKKYFIQALATNEAGFKQIQKAQKTLINYGLRKAKYVISNTAVDSKMNAFYKIWIGPYNSRIEVDLALERVNSLPYFRKQKPYVILR